MVTQDFSRKSGRLRLKPCVSKTIQHRFLARGDRTIDQMIQAARSGKQNILEGSKAATTSKETEIKLTNVDRASLEELLEHYGDLLSVRDLPTWDKDSREARYVRNLAKTTPLTFELFRDFTQNDTGTRRAVSR